jgi:hypothetical protein
MKTKANDRTTHSTFPDGEGLDALPIFFSLTPRPSPLGRREKGKV